MSSSPVKIKENILYPRVARSDSDSKKLRKRISLHGVALEAAGIGILITGASGIGKTTSAMKAMMPGYFWIADDLAVIDRSPEGILVMTGHRKIQKFLHTEQTGIVEVRQIFPAGQIKNKARLDMIIDVVRKGTDAVHLERAEQEVLETPLPCIRIAIPETGYFDQNLLHKAIKHYQEVG